MDMRYIELKHEDMKNENHMKLLIFLFLAIPAWITVVHSYLTSEADTLAGMILTMVLVGAWAGCLSFALVTRIKKKA